MQNNKGCIGALMGLLKGRNKGAEKTSLEDDKTTRRVTPSPEREKPKMEERAEEQTVETTAGDPVEEHPVEPTVEAPEPSPETTPEVAMTILGEAKKLLGVPYLYGSTDPGKGLDCSGFLCLSYEKGGVTLPRTSRDQAKHGEAVKREEARPGDLLVFGTPEKGIHHAGMVISNPGEPITMIHSSSSQGVAIINVDTSSYWKPRLMGIRRVIG